MLSHLGFSGVPPGFGLADSIVYWITNLVMMVFYPLLLVAQAALPLWLLTYEEPHKILSAPSGDEQSHVLSRLAPRRVWLAALLIVVSLVFFLLWFCPLLWCLYSTRWVARCWVNPAGDSAWATSLPAYSQIEGPSARRRRWCRDCEAYQMDRVYYCDYLGKCLPYFDHYCEFWCGVIWLHNLEAYLLFLAMVPVHQVFCLVVSSWAVSKANPDRSHKWHVSILVVCGVYSIQSYLIAKRFWYRIARKNVLVQETQLLDRIWVQVPGGIFLWETSKHGDCPWNLGWMQNLRLIMGPVWSWPLFWQKTTLMEYFETHSQKEPFRMLHPTIEDPPAARRDPPRRRKIDQRRIYLVTIEEDAVETAAPAPTPGVRQARRRRKKANFLSHA